MSHFSTLVIIEAIDDNDTKNLSEALDVLEEMLEPFKEARFNPISKWDYWMLGNSWAGLLTCKIGAVEEGCALHGTVFGAKANQSLNTNKVDICRFDWLDLEATRLVLLDKVDAVIDEDGWQDCKDKSSKVWWVFLSDRIARIQSDDWVAIVDCHI